MSNKRKNQSGKKPRPKPVKRKKKLMGKAAVLADFREFKQRFHQWADKITINWPDGNPMEPGSNYQFVLPQPMVDFIVSLVQRSHTRHGPTELDSDEVERQRLQQVKELREALASGVDEKLDDEDGPVKDGRTFRGSQNEGQESEGQEDGGSGSRPGTECEGCDGPFGEETPKCSEDFEGKTSKEGEDTDSEAEGDTEDG